MGAPRRKNLLVGRRRVEDEGEEEEGSLVTGVEDDSLSDGSAISDADEDADAEASEISDAESVEQDNFTVKTAINGHPEKLADPTPDAVVPSKKASFTVAMHDTEAMMNGLKFSKELDQEEAVHFDDMGKEILEDQPVKSQSVTVSGDTLGEKRRREHEEYKKKRDADPAFVPNRGGFFMHDHRSSTSGQNGFRPLIRNRGRGRGAGEGLSPIARYVMRGNSLYEDMLYLLNTP